MPIKLSRYERARLAQIREWIAEDRINELMLNKFLERVPDGASLFKGPLQKLSTGRVNTEWLLKLLDREANRP